MSNDLHPASAPEPMPAPGPGPNMRLLLRDATPHELRERLSAGDFDARLSAPEQAELGALLQEWSQRALDMMPLRDALMVDPHRGERVYCLLRQAIADDAAAPRPTVDELEPLLPALPCPYNPHLVEYAPPTGWRRTVAIVLVTLGVCVLGVPLLVGQLPIQPAGLPLGLLTLGLLIGIRARWTGYLGSLLIWLVPNLPHFHYDAPLGSLWYAIPLLVMGLLLLMCDQYVRALWRWIRRHWRG